MLDIHFLYGYIPEYAKSIISQKFSVKETFINAILKKNPKLNNTPSVSNNLVVCTGPRCMNKGSYQLLKHIENKYKIESNKYNNKGICLNTKNCMHRCGTSPNMIINDEEISNVTIVKLNEYLDKIK